MSEETTYHLPVLLMESVDALDIRPDGTYVDVTFGGGGHSREILRRLGPDGHLISFDQDVDALANLPADPRITLVHQNFRFMADFLDWMEALPVDGILGDLGVSSHHLDDGGRGFAFRQDGPLDMRMNQTAGRTAADIVSEASAEDLARIFGEWGEVDKPMRLANAIVRARQSETIATTADFKRIAESVIPRNDQSKELAKIFQALRIEVNNEMGALDSMLRGCVSSLRKGGRMVMIAYHSLEDRMVKNTLKSGDPACAEAEQDAIFGGSKAPFRVTQRKPIVPSDDEVARNPRARSARLRWGIKC